MKIKIFFILIFVMYFTANLFSLEFEKPIFFTSYNQSLNTQNIKNELGADLFVLYKFSGITWMTSISLLRAKNNGDKLLEGAYTSYIFEQNILKFYDNFYFGLGLAYYQMDKEDDNNKPKNFEDGYSRNLDSDLFDTLIFPNIRCGFIKDIAKNVFFSFDVKYYFLKTKTRATISNYEENIDLSRAVFGIGFGYYIGN